MLGSDGPWDAISRYHTTELIKGQWRGWGKGAVEHHGGSQLASTASSKKHHVDLGRDKAGDRL